ncbi:vWA domain-containing protein [Nocardiopsis lambiniae]|uniref:VWFA domain-containing protein n=1 Tax=Nocardiopsis lambiniae TaxID=3075539 RepID=A0ABU2M5N5_9ACTN|nr:hypothetical protein [Nocardiopsis sp. DSM 44743]MDT0327947.1 hypothetical protein [Nocardiopsis sp. DSM 44743]
MRFRYRAYMGGPDPLAEPDPPPEEAVAIARELLEPLAGAEGADDAITAVEKAVARYAEGDRTALESVDSATGGLLGRALGAGARELWDRLDRADHGLSPRELRRLGEVALRDARDAPRPGRRPGGREGGPGGEPTGHDVPYRSDRPLDAVATLRRAMVRRASDPTDTALRADDLRSAETEPTGGLAVSLLVDLSHSMTTRSLHEAATRTALALDALVRRHPEDRVRWVGFGDVAHEIDPAALVAHDWGRVPGTNLHHALRLARGHRRRHPGLAHRILVVTDGEPTAHLGEDGDARFSWPASPRTVEVTVAELDAALREGSRVSFFLLSDDPRLRAFRDLVVRRRGVEAVAADAAALAPVLLETYLGGRSWPRA